MRICQRPSPPPQWRSWWGGVLAVQGSMPQATPKKNSANWTKLIERKVSKIVSTFLHIFRMLISAVARVTVDLWSCLRIPVILQDCDFSWAGLDVVSRVQTILLNVSYSSYRCTPLLCTVRPSSAPVIHASPTHSVLLPRFTSGGTLLALQSSM